MQCIEYSQVLFHYSIIFNDATTILENSNTLFTDKLKYFKVSR